MRSRAQLPSAAPSRLGSAGAEVVMFPTSSGNAFCLSNRAQLKPLLHLSRFARVTDVAASKIASQKWVKLRDWVRSRSTNAPSTRAASILRKPVWK